MAFHELEKPFQNICDGKFKGLWFAIAEPFTPSTCLTISGTVEKVEGDYTRFYFNEESSCHYTAAMYYIQNGRNYPYMTEWQDAIEKDVAALNNTVGHRVGTVIQSEVMEF